MHRLWVDFARDGSLPWSPFDRNTRQVYRIVAGQAAFEPIMPAAPVIRMCIFQTLSLSFAGS